MSRSTSDAVMHVNDFKLQVYLFMAKTLKYIRLDINSANHSCTTDYYYLIWFGIAALTIRELRECRVSVDGGDWKDM